MIIGQSNNFSNSYDVAHLLSQYKVKALKAGPDTFIWWCPKTKSLEAMTLHEAADTPGSWEIVHKWQAGEDPTQVRKRLESFVSGLGDRVTAPVLEK